MHYTPHTRLEFVFLLLHSKFGRGHVTEPLQLHFRRNAVSAPMTTAIAALMARGLVSLLTTHAQVPHDQSFLCRTRALPLVAMQLRVYLNRDHIRVAQQLREYLEPQLRVSPKVSPQEAHPHEAHPQEAGMGVDPHLAADESELDEGYIYSASNLLCKDRCCIYAHVHNGLLGISPPRP